MKCYDANVTVVLNTLIKYGYSATQRRVQRQYYERLRSVLDTEENPVFNAETARSWCEDFAPVSIKRNYLQAVNRLDDVYQHGHILASHLKFPFHPTEYYSCLVDDYVSGLPGTLAERTVNLIRFDCLHFCCFAQYNGIQKIEDVDYHFLGQYVSFLNENIGNQPHHLRESSVSTFLSYLTQKGHCRIGHSLYLLYSMANKVITMESLSESTREVIEERRKECILFPPDEFYAVIPDFVQRLKDAGYSNTVTHNAFLYLKCFYLFIDIENLGYDRILVDAWVNDIAPKFFGSASGLTCARRLFEMFEDYTVEGELIPDHYWRHTPSMYDTLPLWYKEQLDRFIEDKKKEGRAQGTIRTYEHAGACFFRFLESQGIDSFGKITPEIVKNYCIEGVQGTHLGKQGNLSRVRMFLTNLELRHIVQEGLHYAIPAFSSGGERIVKICTEEDRQKLEDFCANPTTPREIRDAALLRIGMSTGMRPSDVVKLKWEDVDFQKGCVRFTQSKTGVPHVLNLDVASRNALFVYLRDVRPRTLPHTYLFVSLRVPHNPLSMQAGINAMRLAGISEGGYRKLRKMHATDMIADGATIEEAAQELGHSNTRTVHNYVVLDETRMRLCPLSMEETGLTLDRRRYTDG